GSYWVERLTADIEAGARALIERIDRSGGMLASIESGWVQQQIHEAAYRWAREVESGDPVRVRARGEGGARRRCAARLHRVRGGLPPGPPAVRPRSRGRTPARRVPRELA